MKIFDLWFPKPMSHPLDTEAECVFSWKTAYICLAEPYHPGTGKNSMVNADGRILVSKEAMSAEECCAQIDELIHNLNQLKAKATQEFKKEKLSN